jgi:hypothetical protein
MKKMNSIQVDLDYLEKCKKFKELQDLITEIENSNLLDHVKRALVSYINQKLSVMRYNLGHIDGNIVYGIENVEYEDPNKDYGKEFNEEEYIQLKECRTCKGKSLDDSNLSETCKKCIPHWIRCEKCEKLYNEDHIKFKDCPKLKKNLCYFCCSYESGNGLYSCGNCVWS